MRAISSRQSWPQAKPAGNAAHAQRANRRRWLTGRVTRSLCVFGMLVWGAACVSAATRHVRIHGTVNLAPELTGLSIYGDPAALEGVEVRIETKVPGPGGGGSWIGVATLYTDASGNFSQEFDWTDTLRQIRASVRFRSASADPYALELYSMNDEGTRRAIWEQLADDGFWDALGDVIGCWVDWVVGTPECFPCREELLEHLTDLNGFSLRDVYARSDSHSLYVNGAAGTTTAYHGGAAGWSSTLRFSREFADSGSDADRHANLWLLLRELMKYLDDNGRPFLDKLHVVHPAVLSDSQDGSFADPITDDHDTVYLRDAGYDVNSAFHECMHVWAYQHSEGEELMAEYLFEHCTTHGHTTQPVAFHEGFAEASARALKHLMFPDEYGSPSPFNRYYLNHLDDDASDHHDGPVTNLAQMQKHDEGWESFLVMLLTDELRGFHFGSAEDQAGSNCEGFDDKYAVSVVSTSDAGITFWELLDAVDAFDIDGPADDVEFAEFLSLAAAFSTSFDISRADEMLELADPASTYQTEEAADAAATTQLDITVSLAAVSTDPLSLRRTLTFDVSVKNNHSSGASHAGQLWFNRDLDDPLGSDDSTSSSTVLVALSPGASRTFSYAVECPEAPPLGVSAWNTTLTWRVLHSDQQCDLGNNEVTMAFGEEYFEPDYKLYITGFDVGTGIVTAKVMNIGPVAAAVSSVLRATADDGVTVVERLVPALGFGEHRTYSLDLPVRVSAFDFSVMVVVADADDAILEGDFELDDELVDGESNNAALIVYGGDRVGEMLTSQLDLIEDLYQRGFEPPPVIRTGVLELYTGLEDWTDYYFQNSGNGPFDPSNPETEELVAMCDWFAAQQTTSGPWMYDVFRSSARFISRADRMLGSFVVYSAESTRVYLYRPTQ